MDRRRCAVLVPFATHICPPCESALEELQRRGYEVRRVGGYAAIDQGRSQIVTEALADGFEETFWIDADIQFHPDAVDRLRAYRLPIVSAIYPRKGARAIASEALPETAKIAMGKGGGLIEILYAAAGFLHVRREVYETIRQRLALPTCNERFRRPLVPYFLPMVRPIENGHWYLSEDYAFCHRAREVGFKIMADTTIRLRHLGEYAYGWEDAGLERPQCDSFVFMFADPKRATRTRQTVAFTPIEGEQKR